jgi:hypothetical protein
MLFHEDELKEDLLEVCLELLAGKEDSNIFAMSRTGIEELLGLQLRVRV